MISKIVLKRMFQNNYIKYWNGLWKKIRQIYNNENCDINKNRLILSLGNIENQIINILKINTI